MTSSTEGPSAKPPLLLKQQKAFIKEIPWKKLAALPEQENNRWYDAAQAEWEEVLRWKGVRILDKKDSITDASKTLPPLSDRLER